MTQERYCPWCFDRVDGEVCPKPECNQAHTRTVEDVDPLESEAFSGFHVDWRYRVTKRIKEGGFGAVYKAYDRFADLMVAIKFLCESPKAAVEPRVRARFEREATILGRLRHPNIVSLYDVEGIKDGPPCLIMELLHGSDLEQHLLGHGPLPPHEAIQWLLPVCEALEFAHSQGVLHLDIKPSNIFRHQCPDGTEVIKVLDFGIARILGPTYAARAACFGNVVYGTKEYVAPEVACGSDPTVASDLYSLGVVLYEALSGSPPFTGQNTGEVFSAKVSNAAPPLPNHLDVPKPLRDLVSTLLERSPRCRPKSASEVRQRLEAVFGEVWLSKAPKPRKAVGRGEPVDVGAGEGLTVKELPLYPHRIYLIDLFSRWRKILLVVAALLFGLLLGFGIAHLAGVGGAKHRAQGPFRQLPGQATSAFPKVPGNKGSDAVSWLSQSLSDAIAIRSPLCEAEDRAVEHDLEGGASPLTDARSSRLQVG